MPGVGHPVVAALLGLAAAGLAGLVVAMAWNVHVRQFRLAELLARRTLAAAADPRPAGPAVNGVNGHGDPATALTEAAGAVAPAGPAGATGTGAPAAKETASPVVIEGPDTVVTGEQARYRARLSGGGTVVSWAVGGGSVSQSPDADHPDELLLIADQPGTLTVIVRVRKGLAERRATKTIIAEAEVLPPAPPFTLRLFLQGWTLAVVAVLVIGFAGALVALGSLASADFIALAVPVCALLAVAAVLRGSGDAPGRASQGQPRPGTRAAHPPWYWPSGTRGSASPSDQQDGQDLLGQLGPDGLPYSPARPGENVNHN